MMVWICVACDAVDGCVCSVPHGRVWACLRVVVAARRGEQLPDASRALWLRGFGRVHCVPGLITVLCDLYRSHISKSVTVCVCKYERAKRFLMKYQESTCLHYLSSQQDLWEALLHDRVRSMWARVREEEQSPTLWCDRREDIRTPIDRLVRKLIKQHRVPTNVAVFEV